MSNTIIKVDVWYCKRCKRWQGINDNACKCPEDFKEKKEVSAKIQDGDFDE